MSHCRPSLIAAIAASVGVIVGSLGPWTRVVRFTVYGLDAGNWGKTALALGAVSSVALLTVFFWPRTRFSPRWAVPLAWAAAVAGVAGATYAMPSVIGLMAAASEHVFTIRVGATVEWGLWLLALSSAVLCIAASIVAARNAQYVNALESEAQSQSSWNSGWRSVAIVVSAGIVISGVIYFPTHWQRELWVPANDPSTNPLPSFPSLHSLPNISPTSTTTTSP